MFLKQSGMTGNILTWGLIEVLKMQSKKMTVCALYSWSTLLEHCQQMDTGFNSAAHPSYNIVAEEKAKWKIMMIIWNNWNYFRRVSLPPQTIFFFIHLFCTLLICALIPCVSSLAAFVCLLSFCDKIASFVYKFTKSFPLCVGYLSILYRNIGVAEVRIWQFLSSWSWDTI